MPLLDWGKAIASQLIVWHHLAVYGPMRRAADPLAPELFAWLADPARLAVQVFLVLGGFLAARTLMPAPAHIAPGGLRRLPGQVWERGWRLLRPFWLTLLLALLAAGVARALTDDADTPAAPAALQILSNALLLHDVTGHAALSAGFWYIGIDLQLFTLTALVAALLRGSGLHGAPLAALAVALVGGGVAASLLWLNRLPGADLWAPYFFGSYGLGVLAHWLSPAGAAPPRGVRAGGALALLLLVALALGLAWRSRIALAGLLALALVFNFGQAWLPQAWGQARIRHLARISYGVFLVHYPVSLVVGALLSQVAPGEPVANALGLVAVWLLSLRAGDALQRGVAAWPAWRDVSRRIRTRAPRAAPSPGRDLASNGDRRRFGREPGADALGWPASARRVLP